MVIVILIVLGLCFGSFAEALTWRLHEQAKPRKKRAASDDKLSMLKGRSMCSHCHHKLVWYDLLPLVSWLSLKGKCRYCHKPIGWQAPALELSTAGLFAVSYAFWPVALQGAGRWFEFAIWLIFIVGFVALVAYDLKWMLLPDKIVYPLLGLAILQVLVRVFVLRFDDWTLMTSFWGFICLGGLFYMLFQLSGGKWIGGGDVKLGFVLGILVGGPMAAILLLFIASVLGTAVSAPMLLSKRINRTNRIPFGPFLILATIIVQLFGSLITSWYAGQFIYL
jgi:prepilin signal peptidase PulO-like enzyme (type II secretory pathway)